MKTPVWPLTMSLIFPFNMSFAQSHGRLPLYFRYTNYSLPANKNNQPPVATNGDEVAFARGNGIALKLFCVNLTQKLV